MIDADNKATEEALRAARDARRGREPTILRPTTIQRLWGRNAPKLLERSQELLNA